MIHTVTLPLGQSVEINARDRIVCSRYQGHAMYGTREPTPDNCQEAADQGYTPDAQGCWRSLVIHELLHPWLSAELWGEPSYVLRHETGLERVPYATRLYEEALVLAFQRLLTTLEVPLPLMRHPAPQDLARRFRKEVLTRDVLSLLTLPTSSSEVAA